MNKKQKAYQKTVNRRQTEVTALRFALEAQVQLFHERYLGGDTEPQDLIDALNRLDKKATNRLRRSEKRLQAFGHRRYCEWSHRIWVQVRGVKISGDYTTEADNDGWYHYRVWRVSDHTAPLVYTSADLIAEGSQRIPQGVKSLMIKKGDAEYNKLLEEIT